MTSYLTFEDLKHVPCYVINLDGQEDKWHLTNQRLKDLGFVDIKRYSAVNGKLINPVAELKQQYGVTWFDNFKNKSEQACALSHLNLLNDMLQKNEKYRLIFEDDIIIHSSFHQKFKQLKILKDSFDVLFLGGWFWSKQYNNLNISHLNQALDKELQRNFIRNARSYEAHAYFINMQFASECVSKFKHWRGHRQAVDNFYTEDETLNIRKCLLTHSPLDSLNLDEIRIRDNNICGLIYQTHQYTSNIQPRHYTEVAINDIPVQWVPHTSKTTDTYTEYNLYHNNTYTQGTIIDLNECGVLNIKNGIISNGGLLFSENGEKLHADISWVGRKENRSDLQHKVFWMHQYDRIDDISYHTGTALNLYNIWSNVNAHHAIAETASKLSLLEQYAPNIINEVNWFVIPQNNFILYKHLLEYYSIPENKCLTINYKYSRSFDKIITPVDYGHFNKNVFKNTQKRFQLTFKEPNIQKIFLTRNQCGRDIHNMEEITEYLAANNFVSIDAAQNINIPNILSNAKIVIAAHGAALTNLIFCRPGTVIIELLPEFFVSNVYSNICYSNELQYHGIICKDSQIIKNVSNNTPYSEKSFIVDVKIIDNILRNKINTQQIQDKCDNINLNDTQGQYTFKEDVTHESINDAMNIILTQPPRQRPEIIINAPKIVTSYLIRPS